MSDTVSTQRTTLTRSQLEDPVAIELLGLLQSITSDGRFHDEEIDALKGCLADNEDSQLPAVQVLRRNVETVLADGRVSDVERQWLHKSLETILPKQERDIAAMRRREAAADDREARRAAATPEPSRGSLPEPDGSLIVATYDFMVAGVAYENRSEAARRVKPGDSVYLVRDPANRYSAHAILVLLQDGTEIGYMPDVDAQQLAAVLDWGATQSAEVKKVLRASSYPIPVVWGELYHRDAVVEGAVASSECPVWTGAKGTQPQRQQAVSQAPDPVSDAIHKVGRAVGKMFRK